MSSAPSGAAKGPEQTIWKGSPSWRALFSRLLALAVVLVVLPPALSAIVDRVAPGTLGAEEASKAVGWTVGALFAYELLRFLGRVVRVASTRYTLTNQRLIVEGGALSRQIGEIDLRSVNDTQLHQGVLERLLGIGSIALISTDKTSPVAVLRWMGNPRSLRELVRTRAYESTHGQVFMRTT
ncbi:MAG: PH domain-containing protein [Myxococcaceae bacterium]